jgi:transcriptional regulator GlxA family with amidase domain
LNIGIYIYDGAEVLDFAGPFEVFSTATRVSIRRPGLEPPFHVFTVGPSKAPVKARGGLVVEAGFGMDGHPSIDVLIIPGGVVDGELESPRTIVWIADQAHRARLTASVCTGAFLLGKAGLLSGKRATTHWEDLEDLRRLLPDTGVMANVQWVDEGSVVTSAGISAGLDMSLHLVERLAGKELADATARQMQYRRRKREEAR